MILSNPSSLNDTITIWKRRVMKTKSLIALLSLAFCCASSVYAANVVAVGGDGTVVQSNDSGGNWFIRSSGTTDSLIDLECVGRECWAVGQSGTIIHSQDAGISWLPQDSGTTNPLTAVDFIDNDSGWAVGSEGTVLVTHDGGKIWSPQNLNTVLDFEAVTAVDINTVWVAGESDTIRHTIDGGANWSFQTPGTNNIKAMDSTSPTDGWFTGRSTVGKTIDGGANWIPHGVSVPFGTLRDIQFINSEMGWIGGSVGTFMRSTDGGESWEDAAGFTNTATVISISMVNEQLGWISSTEGVFKTEDGGLTVRRQVTGISGNLSSIAAFDVTLTADFNQDGDIDGDDFLTWQRNAGITSGASLDQGDADANGAVNGADLSIWQEQFGTTESTTTAAIPEPCTLLLLLLGLSAVGINRRRNRGA
jgi:photosystem II stability/assembly factor-like uncharacterized protein